MAEGHAKDAILVVDREISGLDHHALDPDGDIDLAGAVLVGPAMVDAGGIDRQVVLAVVERGC